MRTAGAPAAKGAPDVDAVLIDATGDEDALRVAGPDPSMGADDALAGGVKARPGTLPAGEDASTSWFARTSLGRKLGRGRAWLDEHPRYKLLYICSVYCPLVIAFTVVKEAPQVVLARKSFFLQVVYISVRDSAGWLQNMCTFFWYVQMNLIARLRGEGALERAGRFIHWATLAAFACGLVLMGAMCAAGRSLLAFTSPTDPEAVVGLGLHALYAWAVGLPASVMQIPIGGSLMGMHEFVSSTATLAAWGALGLLVAFVLVELMVDCSTKPEQIDDATYVCPGSRAFLTAVSVAGSAIMWGLVLHVGTLQYVFARRQGMFPHGPPRCGADGPAEALGALRSEWGRDTAGVAVRSVLNNSRDFISLLVSLRLGVNAATVYALFSTASALSYAVPNMISTAVMTEGSKQHGLGRWGVVLWCLRFFHAFAACAGVLFGAIILSQRARILGFYSDETEYAGFAELFETVWPLFVVFQPVYALVAVLGPLLMTTQNYVFWGQAVAACFFPVFLPITIYAAVTGSVFHVILADVLYNAAHLLLLLYKVSFVEMRKIAALAREERAALAAHAPADAPTTAPRASHDERYSY